MSSSPKPPAGISALKTAVCTSLAALLVAPAPARDFADLSIEELMNISITSVSKKETTIHRSPAAVSIVTRDDVARLGITTMPEALRLVPGLSVGRVHAHKWAITSRGFNSEFANKLLVLVDGRAVYSPAFGGVHWDLQDLAMDNLDRIEVIRGPGATLWGANAVNGVINISSKHARDTQGVLVSGVAGTHETGFSARYGGKLAPEVFFRTHVKYADRANFVDATGQGRSDGWDVLNAGFRVDGDPAAGTAFSLIGNYYTGHSGENRTRASLTPPYFTRIAGDIRHVGANLLGKWRRDFSPDSHLSVQAYYDHVARGIGEHLDRETRDTGDIEVQHRFGASSRHDIVWGAGYRFGIDRAQSNFGVSWAVERETTQLFNAFVQDEIKLAPDRLHLIVGTKAEHNDHIGWEIQPGTRLLWTPARQHTVWAAASRAVRTPSRFDRSARLNVAAFRPSSFAPPFLVSLFGSPDVKSEELLAYELGYRFESASGLAFDFAAFRNDYDNLLQLVAEPDRFETSPAPAHVLLRPSTFRNVGNAHTHGVEVSAQWRPTERWKLAASYSWLQMHVRPDPEQESESPEHQIQLRSYYDLPFDLQLNASIAHVSALPGLRIPAYTRVDVGLRWQPTPAFELGVWGQNLLDPQHPEFNTHTSALLTEIPRSFTARATWRF